MLRQCTELKQIVATLERDQAESSRLSDSSRKSAVTARSQDRESGAVIGIKGIGPSDPSDPSPENAEDEKYERAPSPTIGLQSHRAWEQSISSISQLSVHPASRSSNPFRQPSLNELQLETPAEASAEDLQGLGIEDESPLEGDSNLAIGIPSIVDKQDRRSEPRPQSHRLSTDLLPFARNGKLSESRLNLHSW